MKIDWDDVIATLIKILCTLIIFMFFMCGTFGIVYMATKL